MSNKIKIKHSGQLAALRRIEGQIKGIQKMIENDKYCLEIVDQIHAAVGALHKVAEKIFALHLESCVTNAFRGSSDKERSDKIAEIVGVIHRIHKL